MQVDSLPSWVSYHFKGEWAKVGPVWVGHAFLSPESAREILAHHSKKLNRNPIRYNLERIKRSIVDGNFCLTGETIIFDWDGQVRNGNHRITACHLTDTPIEVMVVYGVNPESFRYMDQGSKRTVQNVLSMEGEKNSAVLASGIVFYYSFMNTGSFERASSAVLSGLTISENLKTLSEHPGLRESASFVSGLGLFRKYASGAGWLAAFHYILSQYNKELAERYFRIIHNLLKGNIGADSLPEGWEILHKLSRILIQNQLSTKKLDQRGISAIFIKAWNAVLTGKSPKILLYRTDDPYPQIYGWRYQLDEDRDEILLPVGVDERALSIVE